MAIRFDAATGAKVRFSKKSGAIIPWPEAAAKYGRPVRPPTPGARDTPAEAVAAVTYTPSAALAPYLARARGIFTPTRARDDRVPALLRRVKLAKKLRSRMRSRWEHRRERERTAEAVDAQVGRLLAAAEAERKAAARAAMGVSSTAAATASRAAGAAAAAAAAPRATAAELR